MYIELNISMLFVFTPDVRGFPFPPTPQLQKWEGWQSMCYQK